MAGAEFIYSRPRKVLPKFEWDTSLAGCWFQAQVRLMIGDGLGDGPIVLVVAVTRLARRKTPNEMDDIPGLVHAPGHSHERRFTASLIG